jgi:hypothetical protein
MPVNCRTRTNPVYVVRPVKIWRGLQPASAYMGQRDDAGWKPRLPPSLPLPFRHTATSILCGWPNSATPPTGLRRDHIKEGFNQTRERPILPRGGATCGDLRQPRLWRGQLKTEECHRRVRRIRWGLLSQLLVAVRVSARYFGKTLQCLEELNVAVWMHWSMLQCHLLTWIWFFINCRFVLPYVIRMSKFGTEKSVLPSRIRYLQVTDMQYLLELVLAYSAPRRPVVDCHVAYEEPILLPAAGSATQVHTCNTVAVDVLCVYQNPTQSIPVDHVHPRRVKCIFGPSSVAKV